MKKIWKIIILALAAGLILPVNTQAHMLWLLVNKEAPKVGETVQVEIGWGHKFPKDEDIKEERLGAVKAIGPDGEELKLKKISTTQYELAPPKSGVYILCAQVRPDFLTKTKDGFKLQSKKGVAEVVNCFRFDMAAKTLLNVGRQEHGFERRAQSSLEIMPLKNPRTLKKGAVLSVKVMFQGKPLAGVEVKVAHEKPADPVKPLVSLGKTDEKGEIQVTVDRPGRWLLLASHKTPYENPEECDENFYTASLTWRVR